MADGGKITLRTTLADKHGAEIVVVDEGDGIDVDNINSVFDFCFTTKPTGAGIGLSMALRIIDLHRGTLKINSRRGHGTTVRITLPLRQAVKSFKPAEPGANAGEYHV
jgi:signal transduction histidine kinase